ncbi:MAG TPA: VanZ family protein [Polyangia bacterium]
MVYGVFGFACARALRLRGFARFRLSLATALAVGFGVSDEFHQSFVPGRAVEALDVLADLVGGCLGALVHQVRTSRQASRGLPDDAKP